MSQPLAGIKKRVNAARGGAGTGWEAAACRTGNVVDSGDELEVVRGYAAEGYTKLVVELGTKG